MSENEAIKNEELQADAELGQFISLVDQDTNEEKEFEIIDRAEIDGQLYLALVFADEEEPEEYIILKVSYDGDDMVFETVDDEDEADKVEDFFNDRLFDDIDYDAE